MLRARERAHAFRGPIRLPDSVTGHVLPGDPPAALAVGARTCASALRRPHAVMYQIPIQKPAPVPNTRESLDAAVGIGFGRILNIESRDIFGDEVNLACKLGEDIAERSEILPHRGRARAGDGTGTDLRGARGARLRARPLVLRAEGRVGAGGSVHA